MGVGCIWRLINTLIGVICVFCVASLHRIKGNLQSFFENAAGADSIPEIIVRLGRAFFCKGGETELNSI